MRKPIPRVVLVNLTEGAVHDTECLRIHGALLNQINRDFAAFWGIEVNLTYVRPGTRTPVDPKSAWLVLVKDPEQASTLGLADLTPQGLPLGIVPVSDLL